MVGTPRRAAAGEGLQGALRSAQDDIMKRLGLIRASLIGFAEGEFAGYGAAFVGGLHEHGGVW